MPLNVFDDEWEQGSGRDGYVARLRRLGAVLGAEKLGATLYQLDPGERICPYHFHYVDEEWLLVLEGEPTLRTPEAVHTLSSGDIVAFPRGPDGAHELRNDTSEPVRVLMLSTKENVELVVFPDSGKIGATANRLGQGERVRLMNRPEANLDYFDGEE